MKKFLMAVAALACMGSFALAGPNEGGTIFLHDANIAYTPDIASYCTQGTTPEVCTAADVSVEAWDTAHVWKAFAAFREGSQPRLKGIVFGVQYPADLFVMVAWGECAGFELPDTGWPGTGTGNALVFTETATDTMVPLYWFAGYCYYAGGVFALTAHPTQGGDFADDSLPSVLDPIAGFGTLGFGVEGVVACPGAGPVTGACCFGSECVILTEEDCLGQQGVWYGGVCDPSPCPPPELGACCTPEGACTLTLEAECADDWHGEWTTCDPNPCPFVATETTTWGQIKANYK